MRSIELRQKTLLIRLADNSVIKWESDERKGIPVKTPSDNFK